MKRLTEKLRDLILGRLSDFTDDDDRLVFELNKIIEENGPKACQVIFHILTHLDFGPEEANAYWNDIIAHHRDLSVALDRKVSLRTAICDYFCSINHALKNPIVLEIHIFEKTVNASRYDSLTGLYNRSSFDEELKREISRAKRYGQDLSLLFFDLDDFKKINDSFGHPAGDLALQRVADIIMKEKRAEDIAARYGGEEIVVILPGTAKINALVVGERIRDEVENLKIAYEGETIRLTLSGGLASYPTNADDASDLLKCADNALYRAKGSGKNNISLFSPDKRRYLRIDFIERIKVRKLGFVNTRTLNTKSKNLSVGGILFENDFSLEIGTKLQLSLPIDKKIPLLLIGTVVRVEAIGENRFDIGVSMSLQDIDKITKMEIARLLRKSSVEAVATLEAS